jgi:LmbE family N-acetylglucosaminyl deacetylase
MPKRLIIAPHADDETLGCGGMIAKYPDECTVVILSDKGDGRMDEYHAARNILGYQHTLIAPFATGALALESRTVTSWLDKAIREVRPDMLYLPTPDAHQDHIAAYECGIRAGRLSYTNSAWYVPNIILYGVSSYSTPLYTTPYPMVKYEALTEAQIDRKVAAINAYASQIDGAFDPAELAKKHARYIGAKVNTEYAEEFAIAREVIA